MIDGKGIMTTTKLLQYPIALSAELVSPRALCKGLPQHRRHHTVTAPAAAPKPKHLQQHLRRATHTTYVRLQPHAPLRLRPPTRLAVSQQSDPVQLAGSEHR